MSDLMRTLIERDGLDRKEAADVIREMRHRVFIDGEDPEEVLYDEGLEPDYVIDLLA
jgi:hypothetical protein